MNGTLTRYEQTANLMAVLNELGNELAQVRQDMELFQTAQCDVYVRLREIGELVGVALGEDGLLVRLLKAHDADVIERLKDLAVRPTARQNNAIVIKQKGLLASRKRKAKR